MHSEASFTAGPRLRGPIVSIPLFLRDSVSCASPGRLPMNPFYKKGGPIHTSLSTFSPPVFHATQLTSRPAAPSLSTIFKIPPSTLYQFTHGSLPKDSPWLHFFHFHIHIHNPRPTHIPFPCTLSRGRPDVLIVLFLGHHLVDVRAALLDGHALALGEHLR